MTRAELLDRLRADARWDVAIIGGGATGLGALLDATTRGYRAVLLEAADFAQATSSRSTKLVHGGVRYLAQGNLSLVREALRERGVLLKIAPHLAHARDFLVPAYHWWEIPYYGVGLKIYDWMAGRLGLGSSRWVGRDEARSLAPTLRPEGLRGGIVYQDGQFDDARLAVALMRTALDRGATALNGVAVVGLEKHEGRIAGLRARDVETGEVFAVPARAVINATGVFADEVRRLDEPDAAPMLRPSQGAHLVLGREFLPGDCGILVPRTDDGRVLFAIPWLGRTLLGTTDTPVPDVSAEPRPLAEEVAYLLDYAARYLARPPRAEDVRSAFAGLRPLVASGSGGSTAALSRDHVVRISDAGLVTITGGKWTTYRVMSADAVDRAAAVAGLPTRPSVTEGLTLHGGESGRVEGPLSEYGADAPAVAAVLAEHPEWGEPLHPELPYRTGEVVWAARHELARSVEDVLSRRTRALLLDARASREAAPLVADLLAHELGRDAPWRREQVRQFEALAEGYLPS